MPLLSYNSGQPLNLKQAGSVALSIASGRSCTFNQKYLFHDYSGFQSRWTTVSNNFFNMTSRSGTFVINVRVVVINC